MWGLLAYLTPGSYANLQPSRTKYFGRWRIRDKWLINSLGPCDSNESSTALLRINCTFFIVINHYLLLKPPPESNLLKWMIFKKYCIQEKVSVEKVAFKIKQSSSILNEFITPLVKRTWKKFLNKNTFQKVAFNTVQAIGQKKILARSVPYY